ncbi:MAG: ABC transporter permease subunit, partial [Gammaproteobacteria bacterium]|nr:ABC transporter permease subunit [Gammaproteobacteria bacterium]
MVFALQLLKIFQSFEIELLLGTPIDFFVYSTYIYDLMNQEPPQYGQATVLASLTVAIIAFIIPLQRWILQRRQYTTISSGFKPGLIDLGRWKPVVVFGLWFLILLLTLIPFFSLVFGSFMIRAGYFGLDQIFTLEHWETVLTSNVFLTAVSTTLLLGTMATIFSPLLFSLLAYVLVRTDWPGRGVLDWIIWSSGAIPGMLSGLGLLVLFLGTPGFSWLYGTIWALLLVVIISGNTTGTNIMKASFVQIGQELEDAARISGAGWFRTYFRIWIPLLMPTMILIGTLNFVSAVGATSSIILLASRDTMTLSILALEYRLSGFNQEAASVVSIIIMLLTAGVAL